MTETTKYRMFTGKNFKILKLHKCDNDVSEVEVGFIRDFNMSIQGDGFLTATMNSIKEDLSGKKYQVLDLRISGDNIAVVVDEIVENNNGKA